MAGCSMRNRETAQHPTLAHPFEMTLPFTQASRTVIPLKGRDDSSFHWPCNRRMTWSRAAVLTTVQHPAKDRYQPRLAGLARTHPGNQGAIYR